MPIKCRGKAITDCICPNCTEIYERLVMKVSEIFHGDSLNASDLKGKDVTVTIEGWGMKEYDDGQKPELRFVESDRTLILNKTNAQSIAEDLKEEDLDRWKGACITIYPTKTDFGGKRVDCIRVKAAFYPETESDTPF